MISAFGWLDYSERERRKMLDASMFLGNTTRATNLASVPYAMPSRSYKSI